jgi:hypothetical protein
MNIKAGDLVRFKQDGQLMLITSTAHGARVLHGEFVVGPRAGKGVTTYASLIEKAYESR